MACDLTQAIESAAFEYLKGVLINRILKLLGKRITMALVALIGSAVADGPLPIGDIIGLIISIGIGLWTAWDLVALIKQVVNLWKEKIWDGFKRTLLKKLIGIDPNIMDCLDKKPECCLIVIQKAGKILKKWVKGLKPKWHKRSALVRGAKFSKAMKEIKRELAGPLTECCNS